MKSQEYKLSLKILEFEIQKQGLNGKKLAALVGVSESSVTKWRRGEGLSGENLAKLAQALKVAIPYLLGATTNPLPDDLGSDPLMIELIRAAQKLSTRRQRDLITVANAYWEASERLRGNQSLLAEELLALAQEAAGPTGYRRLMEYLSGDDWKDDDSPLTLEGSEPIDPSSDK